MNRRNHARSLLPYFRRKRRPIGDCKLVCFCLFDQTLEILPCCCPTFNVPLLVTKLFIKSFLSSDNLSGSDFGEMLVALLILVKAIVGNHHSFQ